MNVSHKHLKYYNTINNNNTINKVINKLYRFFNTCMIVII